MGLAESHAWCDGWIGWKATRYKCHDWIAFAWEATTDATTEADSAQASGSKHQAPPLCKQGHELHKYIREVFEPKPWCDGCGNCMRSLEKAWRCELCKYDLCSSCYAKRLRTRR